MSTDLRVVVSSPLLIARVRSAGGAGGRRVRIGLLGDDFAVAVEQGQGEPSVTVYGSLVAAVHGYNGEVRRARRDGLTSRPEPAELSVGAFERSLRAAGRP